MNHIINLGHDLPIGARHYRAFVGPPEKYDLVSAMQFNLMTHLGLREYHFLLDIGCGSLRAGRLFIPYLLPAHYYGVEPEPWLIQEGIKNELGQDILRIKQPIFSHDANFNFQQFNVKFDFILAQSIFSHASEAQIKTCLCNITQCLAPDGVMAATFVKGLNDYGGRDWVYPDCVTYTLVRMQGLANVHGLIAEAIGWPHPNGQTWLLIKHSSKK
jgi:hypothetical protein